MIQDSTDGKYLYQRVEGGTIFFQMRRNGRKIVKSLRTNSFARAKIERAKLLIKYSKTPEVQQAFVKVVTVADLFDDYYEYLEAENADHPESVAIMKQVMNNTREHPVYKARTADSITSADNWAYRKARLQEGKAPATCNNELSYMRSAFRYGQKQTPPTVVAVPYFPIVKVKNARQGFIEFAEYRRLRTTQSPSVDPFLVLAYHTGCRSGELQHLEWKANVDFTRKQIVLQPGTTKNDEGRILPFYGDMGEVLTKQFAIRQAQFPNCPYVFFWHTEDCQKGPTQRGGTQRTPGTQMKRFRDDWKRAATVAGFPNLLIHDLRRSAVSNMIQEFGMDEDEAMEISGHKDRSMLIRYNIRKPGKLAKIGVKLQEGFEQMRAKD